MTDWHSKERERERESERTEVDRLPPVSTATDPPSTATDRLIRLLLKQIGACWSRSAGLWVSRLTPGPELEPQRLTPGPELDASHLEPWTGARRVTRPGPEPRRRACEDWTDCHWYALSLSFALCRDSLLILKTWSYCFLAWVVGWIFILFAAYFVWCALTAFCWVLAMCWLGVGEWSEWTMWSGPRTSDFSDFFFFFLNQASQCFMMCLWIFFC